jgi:predicted HNH restriction endonuclease
MRDDLLKFVLNDAVPALHQGAVTYDVAADFAVLCANCHRMIHRTEDPSDLETFKKRI